MNLRQKFPWIIWNLRENFDRWSRFHLFGTYTLTDLSDRWWVGFIGAWLWEFADTIWYIETHYSKRAAQYWFQTNLKPDELHPQYVLMDEILDRRGFSWLDLALGLFAVLVWAIAQ